MKKSITIITLTVLCSFSIRAGAQIASTSTETAVTTSPEMVYELLSSINKVSALLSSDKILDEKKAKTLREDILTFENKLKTILGPALLGETDTLAKNMAIRKQYSDAKDQLAAFRLALISYYTATEGTYPASETLLIPKYLASVPDLNLPEHTRTNTVVSTNHAGKDAASVITDTGGWIYFNNSKSPYFGMVILNCSHKDTTGTELYKY